MTDSKKDDIPAEFDANVHRRLRSMVKIKGKKPRGHKAILDAHREGIKILLQEDIRSISYILQRLHVSGTAPEINRMTLWRYVRGDSELTEIMNKQIENGHRPDYRNGKLKE